jgi:hypothetical protein
MDIEEAAVVILVLWIGLTADAWIIAYNKGRRDLEFYLLILAFPPAGLIAAIATPPKRPPRAVPVMDVQSDGFGPAPRPDPGSVGSPVMAPQPLDQRDLVAVTTKPPGLDADGQALPKHDWWLPHRSTVVIDDTTVRDGDR